MLGSWIFCNFALDMAMEKTTKSKYYLFIAELEIITSQSTTPDFQYLLCAVSLCLGIISMR